MTYDDFVIWFAEEGSMSRQIVFLILLLLLYFPISPFPPLSCPFSYLRYYNCRSPTPPFSFFCIIIISSFSPFSSYSRLPFLVFFPFNFFSSISLASVSFLFFSFRHYFRICCCFFFSSLSYALFLLFSFRLYLQHLFLLFFQISYRLIRQRNWHVAIIGIFSASLPVNVKRAPPLVITIAPLHSSHSTSDPNDFPFSVCNRDPGQCYIFGYVSQYFFFSLFFCTRQILIFCVIMVLGK